MLTSRRSLKRASGGGGGIITSKRRRTKLSELSGLLVNETSEGSYVVPYKPPLSSIPSPHKLARASPPQQLRMKNKPMKPIEESTTESWEGSQEDEFSPCSKCSFRNDHEMPLSLALLVNLRQSLGMCGHWKWMGGNTSRRIQGRTRAQLLNFLVHCQCKLPHPPSPYTLHIGISCFDRFSLTALKRGDQNAKQKLLSNLPAVAAACLHLASKMEDVWPVDAADLETASARSFTRKDVLLWERRVCQVLDFRITIPTTLDFIAGFVRHAQRAICCRSCRNNNYPDESQSIQRCATFLAEMTLIHPLGVDMPYDKLAAASVALAAIVLDPTITIRDPLPSEICKLTGGVDEQSIGLVLGVFLEYLSSTSNKTPTASETQNEIRLCLPPVEHGGKDPIFTPYFEAVAEYNDNPKQATLKLASFLISRAHLRGISLSGLVARDIAFNILTGEISRPTGAELSEAAQCPVVVSTPHFAADVIEKHSEAVEQFSGKFGEWRGKNEDLVKAWQYRETVAAPVDHHRTRAHSIEAKGPTTKGTKRRRGRSLDAGSPTHRGCSTIMSSSSSSCTPMEGTNLLADRRSSRRRSPRKAEIPAVITPSTACDSSSYSSLSYDKHQVSYRAKQSPVPTSITPQIGAS